MNALGDDFIPSVIAEVVVAHYDESVAELERQFLDLELIAEGIWRYDVPAETSVELSSLRDEAGQPFPGIDGNGTWLVALMCGDFCRNPAPWYLTVLVPCSLR